MEKLSKLLLSLILILNSFTNITISANHPSTFISLTNLNNTSTRDNIIDNKDTKDDANDIVDNTNDSITTDNLDESITKNDNVNSVHEDITTSVNDTNSAIKGINDVDSFPYIMLSKSLKPELLFHKLQSTSKSDSNYQNIINSIKKDIDLKNEWLDSFDNDIKESPLWAGRKNELNEIKEELLRLTNPRRKRAAITYNDNKESPTYMKLIKSINGLDTYDLNVFNKGPEDRWLFEFLGEAVGWKINTMNNFSLEFSSEFEYETPTNEIMRKLNPNKTGRITVRNFFIDDNQNTMDLYIQIKTFEHSMARFRHEEPRLKDCLRSGSSHGCEFNSFNVYAGASGLGLSAPSVPDINKETFIEYTIKTDRNFTPAIPGVFDLADESGRKRIGAPTNDYNDLEFSSPISAVDGYLVTKTAIEANTDRDINVEYTTRRLSNGHTAIITKADRNINHYDYNIYPLYKDNREFKFLVGSVGVSGNGFDGALHNLTFIAGKPFNNTKRIELVAENASLTLNADYEKKNRTNITTSSKDTGYYRLNTNVTVNGVCNAGYRLKEKGFKIYNVENNSLTYDHDTDTNYRFTDSNSYRVEMSCERIPYKTLTLKTINATLTADGITSTSNSTYQDTTTKGNIPLANSISVTNAVCKADHYPYSYTVNGREKITVNHDPFTRLYDLNNVKTTHNTQSDMVITLECKPIPGKEKLNV